MSFSRRLPQFHGNQSNLCNICRDGGIYRRLRRADVLHLAYRSRCIHHDRRRSLSHRHGSGCTTITGALLPFNWTQVVKVTPGQKLSDRQQ